MTLEVGEHHGEVIVQVVRAHEVLLQVLAARDRQSRLAVRIHDVHGSDGRESVVLGSLATGFRGAALAGVGRVALHDGAVHFLYQVLDEGGLQEVVSARFARGDFDGHLARGFAAQGLVNLHQVLGPLRWVPWSLPSFPSARCCMPCRSWLPVRTGRTHRRGNNDSVS